MVTLRWGDIISILLPGVVALFGLKELVPFLQEMTFSLHKLSLSAGVFLLLCAGISGGVIDALRRIVADDPMGLIRRLIKWVRVTFCKETTALQQAGPGLFYYISPQNLRLFEAGVENSWRYYVFYCNLAFAVLVTLVVRVFFKYPISLDGALLFAVVILFIAAKVQHGLWRNFESGFIEREREKLESQKLKGGRQNA